MSKSESLKRQIRRKAYRKATLIINVTFTIIIAFIIIYGLTHTFTKKTEYYDKGVDCYKAYNYEDAIGWFDKALGCKQMFSEELNVDIELYMADSYLKMDDFSSAKEIYTRVKKKYSKKYYDEERLEFMITLTDNLILFSNGDYVTPLETLKQAVDKGYTELSLYVAMCYENVNDLDNMKQYYDIYSQSLGVNSYLALKYTQYYIEIEDYETALSYSNQGINLEDKEYIKELKYLQIVCNIKLAKYEYAYTLAETYVIEYPDDMEGQEIYEYLDTRINMNEVPINDKFDLYE